MADTHQIVIWALEQTCPLRKDAAIKSPDKACHAVSRARAYSESLRNKRERFGIFGDVCVSGHGYAILDEKHPLPYPRRGFVISKEFESVGGPSGLFSMCAPCQSNTTRNEIAGCCGTLQQWPDSSETEAQIRGILARLGLERELDAAFPKTNPIWYGLWAVSPVPTRSLSILRTIISEMRTEDAREMEINHKTNDKHLRDFALFAKAIELAERHNIPLHVELMPLGHTDDGVYTLFPHCPFCKAAARIKRWQMKYPAALYTCHVCGREYSPAETAASERMTEPQNELMDLLGPVGYLDFARQYLVAHGQTPERADEIVREMEVRDARRQEELREMQKRVRKVRALTDALLAKYVFAGLETVPPPVSIWSDDVEAEDKSKECWFRGQEFAEVLRRCDTLGIAVISMQHDSPDGKTDRWQFLTRGTRRIESPLEVLDQWRKEGCDGKFHASFNVLDKLDQ